MYNDGCNCAFRPGALPFPARDSRGMAGSQNAQDRNSEATGYITRRAWQQARVRNDRAGGSRDRWKQSKLTWPSRVPLRINCSAMVYVLLSQVCWGWGRRKIKQGHSKTKKKNGGWRGKKGNNGIAKFLPGFPGFRPLGAVCAGSFARCCSAASTGLDTGPAEFPLRTHADGKNQENLCGICLGSEFACSTFENQPLSAISLAGHWPIRLEEPSWNHGKLQYHSILWYMITR